MTDLLKELAQVLIKILCKKGTVEVWMVLLPGIAGLCGIGGLQEWYGFAFLAFVGLVVLGVLVAYGKMEGKE